MRLYSNLHHHDITAKLTALQLGQGRHDQVQVYTNSMQCCD